MRNNRMRFGDVIVRQLVGISMAMSPAPTIANLFVAIHEALEILKWLDSPFLLLLHRFIDDGFGIWIHHRDPGIYQQRWASFKAAVNNDRSPSVDFMDMTISIAGNKIETTLWVLQALGSSPSYSTTLMSRTWCFDWPYFWQSATGLHSLLTAYGSRF
ncbi:hypothetical protein ACHAWF_006986 [Thalassiosira exigua]